MPLNAIRRDAVFVILAAALVLLYVLTAGGGFPLDDSWIHQTFGRNLAQSGEWAFIPGQPSAASTSPLYTVLLSIGYALGIAYPLWTHTLGIAALSVAAVVNARLAKRLLPDTKGIDWATGLAMLFTWHLIWAAASGMETMLFSALSLVLIGLAWREWTPEQSYATPALILRGALFGLITGLIALARPEGILLGGWTAGLLLLTRPAGWRGVLIWGSASALVFSVVMSPYLILNLQLTGGLLPDTAAAKFAQHVPLLAQSYPARYADLLRAILTGGQILLVPGMIVYAGWIVQRRQLVEALPLLWALSLIAVYAARLPASYQHGRYVMPALPALIFCGVIGTALILRWGATRRGMNSGMLTLRRTLTRTFALTIAALMVAFTLIIGPGAYRTDVAIINEEMVAAAQWIDANIPPDDLLAIHDIGAVGYFTPRPLLDIAGLVTPEVIPIVTDAGALWALMESEGAEYLMAFPDQIPGDDPTDPRLCRVFDTGGPTAQRQGADNMRIYRLDWSGACSVE